MKNTIHERPGVYSSYDASAIIRGGRAVRVVGVAAKSAAGTPNVPVTLTSYEAGLSAFGEDEADAPGMSAMLRLLFLGGAATVVAVAVEENGYAAAFAALQGVEDVQVVVCDSGDLTVQQALRESVEAASSARRERLAVVGMSSASAAELKARAKELNSERMVLVGPDVADASGKKLPGMFAAAAVAAAIAAVRDPAVPLNGTALPGLSGVAEQYGDSDVDLLVQGGVTPLEAVAGAVSPIRGITTRTTTGGTADATWRELTTVMVVDEVIPGLRNALRAKFNRAKNTTQTRGAICSQTMMELEKRVSREIIDSYEDVTVTALEDDPTVCLVEFAFTVAHGLNQVWLSAHITV